MAFNIDGNFRLVNDVISPCSPFSSSSLSSSSSSSSSFSFSSSFSSPLSSSSSSTTNETTSSLVSPSPHKKPNLNTISPIKEPVYYLTQSFNELDGTRISNLELLPSKQSSTIIGQTSSNTIIDNEVNLTEMIELNVADFSVNDKINGIPLGCSVSTVDANSDCSITEISVDDGVTDAYQAAQVKLIQIPSNANVIQVPSNLLVTSNNNLILCLPSEGITFQVQSTSQLDSSMMETNANEIYNSSTNCNQSSSFTTLTPITFPDIIQKSIPFDGSINEIQSPEIQLEKAQTWHRDSQLAIVALAALKATNKLTQIEMQ